MQLHKGQCCNKGERGTGSLGWGFGRAGMILPVLGEVALPWGQAVSETTATGQRPFLLCVMRGTVQCLLTCITIIYTVKSHKFNQLKGVSFGLPEGNDEVGR